VAGSWTAATYCSSPLITGRGRGSAGYAGVRVERVMLQTLPYTWAVAVGGLVLTAVRFL
jgi:hypothetical protein